MIINNHFFCLWLGLVNTISGPSPAEQGPSAATWTQTGAKPPLDRKKNVSALNNFLNMPLISSFPLCYPLTPLSLNERGVHWVHIPPPDVCPPGGSTLKILILNLLVFLIPRKSAIYILHCIARPKTQRLRKEINYIEDDNFLNHEIT